jgi:hypothetical protein
VLRREAYIERRAMKVVFGFLLALARVAGLGVQPAATLSVRVVPALDPRGGAWIVQLFEESSELRKPVDERPVDADGAWSTSAARYGIFYRLRISTAAGDGWYADDRPFECDPERGRREVRLASSAFRARLVLGKKPLAGRVTFTDRDGLVAVPFASRTDGTFEGVLPRDGWWSVTVAADRPHFKSTFDVKVDPVFRDGTPPDVEIRVVSKAIQGEIVDLKNGRVPVASLSVSGFQEPLKVEGGWFTWDKVVDGWMTVHATARGLTGFESSPFRRVRVSGGWVDPGFLSLEIRPTYVLKGRAVLPSGEPAAGARIRIVSSPFYEIRTTPADGRFQMTVRGGGERACLLVVDPSKAARLVPVPASESEQDVPVAEKPGTLSLEFTPRGERRIETLVANGCRLSWFRSPGLPQVPSGSTVTTMKSTFRVSTGAYALCGLEPGEFDDDAEIPPEACVSGVLPPGGTLSLRLNP